MSNPHYLCPFDLEITHEADMTVYVEPDVGYTELRCPRCYSSKVFDLRPDGVNHLIGLIEQQLVNPARGVIAANAFVALEKLEEIATGEYE